MGAKKPSGSNTEATVERIPRCVAGFSSRTTLKEKESLFTVHFHFVVPDDKDDGQDDFEGKEDGLE